MILRPRIRPSGVSRAFEQIQTSSSSIKTRPAPLSNIRCYATPQTNRRPLPDLGHNNADAEFFATNGVPGFLTPRTFRQNWTAYQNHLMDQIHEQVAETGYHDKSPYQLHTEFSRQPEHANLYNITAMAHFNHFFFDSLAKEKVEVPDQLARMIDEGFSSLDNLRQEMLENGAAIFGNGFVWLLKEGGTPPGKMPPLRILCTYNAGSPYSEAYRMRQSRDMATGYAGAVGPYSRSGQQQFAPNALKGVPILCLNVWQHMYVPDYGVLGKNTYLAAWWERIDWNKVAERYSRQDPYAVGGNDFRGLLGMPGY